MGTLCHYIVLWGLVMHHVEPVAASGCGMLAGAAVVYVINYHITFSSSRRHVDTIKSFLPMAGVGFCLNGIILACALEHFSFSLPVSQIIATAGQFAFGFFISRRWVF